MEAVIVIAQRDIMPELRIRLASLAPLAGSEGALVIQDERTRVYLSRDDRVIDELEPDRRERITGKMPSPIFYTVDFSDIELCRKVLFLIADDPTLLVDNDHGTLLRGPEFLELLRSQPAWDWRITHPRC
ncbi:MAG TPA: hypothetical protein VFF06_05520 [Polyangia bacterium]|nr:hypothetical protein [Polyangia bacterium]